MPLWLDNRMDILASLAGMIMCGFTLNFVVYCLGYIAGELKRGWFDHH